MNRAATSISGVSGGTAVVRPLLTFAGVNTARSSESRPRRLVQLLLVVLLTVSALPLQAFIAPAAKADALPFTAPQPRSEEHTSELQSLMRISYAVFCLKKKNSNTHKTRT